MTSPSGQFIALRWVAGRQTFHNIHSFNNLTKHGVSAVELVYRIEGDKELASVRVGAGIGHTHYACFVKQQSVVFVAKFVAWAAQSKTAGVAGLCHKARQDSVEGNVVKPAFL